MYDVPNACFSRFVTLRGSNSFHLEAKTRNPLALNSEITTKRTNIAAAHFQGGHPCQILSLICQNSRSFCLLDDLPAGRYGGATANGLTAKIQNYGFLAYFGPLSPALKHRTNVDNCRSTAWSRYEGEGIIYTYYAILPPTNTWLVR